MASPRLLRALFPALLVAAAGASQAGEKRPCVAETLSFALPRPPEGEAPLLVWKGRVENRGNRPLDIGVTLTCRSRDHNEVLVLTVPAVPVDPGKRKTEEAAFAVEKALWKTVDGCTEKAECD